MQKVITRGREPGLLLDTPGGEQALLEVGKSLLDQMRTTGELLDEVHETKAYGRSVNAQIRKLEDGSQTPSAQVLKALQESGLSYPQWVVLKSREHKESIGQMSSTAKIFKDLARRAADSIKEQQQLEASRGQGF